ncbi:unnamed protein product [Ambrosiozyma monospora]|uniref:Unnamed protein product n=1 Tax=Ambrosiozyma monospora TaxID=43982 RepID=A0A9W7DGH3_AMBMO|nr:unnamed protein product [Ambrosiozyma monospora]
MSSSKNTTIASNTPSPTNSQSDQGTTKPKRERSTRACLVCRQRKVKCDAVERHPDRCTNCVQFNIQECIIPVPRKRKSRKIKEVLDSLNNNNSKKQKLEFDDLEESLNQSVPDFVSEDLQTQFPFLSELTLDPKVVLNPHIDTSLIQEYIGHTAATPLMKQMVMDYFGNRHATFSSFRMDIIQFRYLRSLGCFNLPNEDLCKKYIETYFEEGNPQYPILNRELFAKDFADLRNPPSLLLLQSVLYAGARLCMKPEMTDKELGDHGNLLQILRRRVLAIFDAKIETDMVQVIQSILLFANHSSLQQINDRSSSFLHLKLAISCAYCAGLHRNQDDSKELTLAQKRVHKRLWWVLFAKDLFFSLSYGRPWAIDVADYNVPPLTESDLLDSLEKENEQTELKDPKRNIEINFFLQKINLALIVRRVIDNQLSIKKYSLENTSLSPMLERCNKLMAEWSEGLPSNLTFKPNNNIKDNNYYSAVLGLEYYSILLLTHRNNIIRTSTVGTIGANQRNQIEQNRPSWSITLKSAHILTLLGKYLLESGTLTNFKIG